jgi:tetratricopeptide (TPR) repeat protein
MNIQGFVLLQAGRYEEALAEQLRALAFLEQAGARVQPHMADFTRIYLQIAIGRSHASLGNWPEAAAHLRTALGLCRTSGYPVLESRTLHFLGDVLLAAGDRDQARDAFTQCVALGTAADPNRLKESRKRLLALSA